jgi:hypothetical protein
MGDRAFPVAVVISAYRDRLVCPFDEYREFLDYMVGAELFLHDVAAARRAVAAHLDRVAPELSRTTPMSEKTDNGTGVRHARKVAKQLGTDVLILEPMPPGAFRPRTVAEAYAW